MVLGKRWYVGGIVLLAFTGAAVALWVQVVMNPGPSVRVVIAGSLTALLAVLWVVFLMALKRRRREMP